MEKINESNEWKFPYIIVAAIKLIYFIYKLFSSNFTKIDNVIIGICADTWVIGHPITIKN